MACETWEPTPAEALARILPREAEELLSGPTWLRLVWKGIGGAVRVGRGRPVWARSCGVGLALGGGWAICQVEAWGRGLVRSIRGRGLCCGLGWVLTICGSVATPLLKVVVNVEAQASLYQGT